MIFAMNFLEDMNMEYFTQNSVHYARLPPPYYKRRMTTAKTILFFFLKVLDKRIRLGG